MDGDDSEESPLTIYARIRRKFPILPIGLAVTLTAFEPDVNPYKEKTRAAKLLNIDEAEITDDLDKVAALLYRW